jgi:hypothetical protein
LVILNKKTITKFQGIHSRQTGRVSVPPLAIYQFRSALQS